MNARQRKAYENIRNATEMVIWEKVNVAYLSEDEKRDVLQYLNNTSKVVEEVYKEATTAICGDGFYTPASATEIVTKAIRDINFCGREWLMDVVVSEVNAEIPKAIAEINDYWKTA